MTDQAQAGGPIAYADFQKVAIKVGRVVSATDHPNADKLLVLQVDLGNEKRQIVAGLRGHYTAAEMVGKNIVVVTNLAPRMMRGQQSNGMLLAAVSADQTKVIVLTTDREVEPGSAVS
ncbi:MAG TPA: methionine--tRNA ligase subunit beta [Phycisphaerae bacterium]|nr:methionine--tRNA ligase subunit beta [Phycisphaerae bacterium]HNU46114.1 methionine--tRNA ligase subunit beta [Phycisphaerae bacterium]